MSRAAAARDHVRDRSRTTPAVLDRQRTQNRVPEHRDVLDAQILPNGLEVQGEPIEREACRLGGRRELPARPNTSLRPLLICVGIWISYCFTPIALSTKQTGPSPRVE